MILPVVIAKTRRGREVCERSKGWVVVPKEGDATDYGGDGGRRELHEGREASVSEPEAEAARRGDGQHCLDARLGEAPLAQQGRRCLGGLPEELRQARLLAPGIGAPKELVSGGDGGPTQRGNRAGFQASARDVGR